MITPTLVGACVALFVLGPGQQSSPARFTSAPPRSGEFVAAEGPTAPPSGVQIVDLRDDAAFARGRLPGSVQRRPWELRLLRGPVLLVDAGVPGGPAERGAAALKARGVSVEVLAGGFRAWCERGGEVLGTCERADVVTPSQAGRMVAVARCAEEAELLAGLGVTVVAPEALPNGAVVAAASVGAARPGVFWLDGGVDALLAARAPAGVGETQRTLSGRIAPIGTAPAGKGGCGCQH